MALFGMNGKNARAIGSALLIVTFIAGALAGAAMIRVLSADTHAEPGVRARSGAPTMKSGPRRLLLDETFSKEIGLTAEQRVQIKEILDRRDVEAKKLWDGFEPTLKEVGRQVHDEINKVLTPEQRTKFEAALAQHRSEHKKRRECTGDSTRNSVKDSAKEKVS
jgi:Spy/CpxP family protein refolding chaperone